MVDRERALINDPELEQNYPNYAYFKKLRAYMHDIHDVSLA